MQKFHLYKALVSFFFIITLVYTCRAFIPASSENIFPYIVLYTARLSLLHYETLFSPSKYIGYKCYSCFRPGMGHFYFHRHTYPIYCFGHSSSQSVSQWNSFSPLKYIVYKCFSCFRPGMGLFFFIDTLVYICPAFFWLYHLKMFVPYIACLSLFCNKILFLL